MGAAAAAAVADEEEEEAAAVSREIDGEATSIIDVSTLKRKKVFFGVVGHRGFLPHI